MKLTFWGAAGEVTGSMHHLEIDGKQYLLDCGLCQGHRKEADAKNRKLPFPAESIDTVIVSHAHIDHTGNLPTLVKNGFRGPIYATPATVDLCIPMLRDTAFIQERDAEFLNKRRRNRDSQELVEPLYTIADAEQTLPLFRPVSYYSPMNLDRSLNYECYDAGHMLGSSAIILHHREDGKRIRLAFSGDIGRPGLPVIRNPDALPPAEYLIMESTYGGRLHKNEGHVANKLADVINRTSARGGRIIVPAFAVGRTQQLVVLLHELANHQRIPNIPIFVDSPLAVNVTSVYRHHPECFDAETRQYLLDGEDPFGFSRLQYLRDAEESKRLNGLHGPMVVISPSGMAEHGRVLHHLRNHIEDPRNTVLITGFQAVDTLGRKLVEKQKEVRIFGDPMTVRAEIVSLDELSGHADQNELLAWLKPLAAHVKQIFLVHGEPAQSETLAKRIQSEYGIDTVVPRRGQNFLLSHL